MRARLTFVDKVQWNYGSFLAWGANVQGVPTRGGWTLVFKPIVSLNELCFEGEVEWLAEPKQLGFVSGVKFQYLNHSTRSPFAVGEIL